MYLFYPVPLLPFLFYRYFFLPVPLLPRSQKLNTLTVPRWTGTGKRYLRVYIQIRFRHACHETRDRQSRSLVSGQVLVGLVECIKYQTRKLPNRPLFLISLDTAVNVSLFIVTRSMYSLQFSDIFIVLSIYR